MDEGWIFLEEHRYGAAINNCVYDMHINTDDNGKISSWFINNWLDIDIPDVIEDIYYNSLEE